MDFPCSFTKIRLSSSSPFRVSLGARAGPCPSLERLCYTWALYMSRLSDPKTSTCAFVLPQLHPHHPRSRSSASAAVQRRREGSSSDRYQWTTGTRPTGPRRWARYYWRRCWRRSCRSSYKLSWSAWNEWFVGCRWTISRFRLPCTTTMIIQARWCHQTLTQPLHIILHRWAAVAAAVLPTTA